MKIKLLSATAKAPTYATIGSAGFDLAADEDILIMPQESAIVSTGIAFEVPQGFEMQIRPRSGISSKTKLRVILGTVDADFRGEIKIMLDNTGTLPYHIQRGDRIAQAVISPIRQVIFETVKEFEAKTSRGENGFGSSGI